MLQDVGPSNSQAAGDAAAKAETSSAEAKAAAKESVAQAKDTVHKGTVAAGDAADRAKVGTQSPTNYSRAQILYAQKPVRAHIADRCAPSRTQTDLLLRAEARNTRKPTLLRTVGQLG